MSLLSRKLAHLAILVVFLFTAFAPAPLLAQHPETESQFSCADDVVPGVSDAKAVARATFAPAVNA